MNTKKPYKFNDLKKSQWLKVYEKTGSFTNACRACRVSNVIVYDRLNPAHRLYDIDFKKEKEELDNLVIDVVEGRLFGLTRTNPTACFFYLCNRRPDKWHNVNQAVVHPGGLVNENSNVDMSGLTVDELKRLAQLVKL